MLSWQSSRHHLHTNHVVMAILRAFSTHYVFNAILIHHNSWHGSDFKPFDWHWVFANKTSFLLIFFILFPSILALLWRHNGKVYTYFIDSVNSSPRFDQVAAYFCMTAEWRTVQRSVIVLQNIPKVKQKTFHFQLADCVNGPNGRAMKSEMTKKWFLSMTVKTTKHNFIVTLCKLEFSSSSKKQTGDLGVCIYNIGCLETKKYLN